MTCCETIQDLYVGEDSLYEKLTFFFNQEEEEYWNDSEKIPPVFSMRYVILDEKPDSNISFEELSAKIINEMLYCSHVSGCYSEWTCGYGGFDYLVNNGHSIFEELESYIGKYVHLTF